MHISSKAVGWVAGWGGAGRVAGRSTGTHESPSGIFAKPLRLPHSIAIRGSRSQKSRSEGARGGSGPECGAMPMSHIPLLTPRLSLALPLTLPYSPHEREQGLAHIRVFSGQLGVGCSSLGLQSVLPDLDHAPGVGGSGGMGSGRGGGGAAGDRSCEDGSGERARFRRAEEASEGMHLDIVTRMNLPMVRC